MGSLGITELLIIAVIVLVLFGTKRLRNIGSDLGSAIKGFKQSMKDEQAQLDNQASNPPPAQSTPLENQKDKSNS